MKKLLAPLAMAALLLTGCGGIVEAAPSPTSASPTPSPTPTPTTTAAQFASVIAEYETNWRDYSDEISNCAFARVVGKSAVDEIKVTTCGTTVVTVTLNAKTAARELRALGKPPAEVSALASRTLVALDALGSTGADKGCSDDKKSQACDEGETLANGAIRPVITVLDAWKPYTR